MDITPRRVTRAAMAALNSPNLQASPATVTGSFDKKEIMDITPRRVTRAAMAALNSPNLQASPAIALVKTPATKRKAQNTPSVSTGKRGRPRKVVLDETKENIPHEEVTIARKILHLDHPDMKLNVTAPPLASMEAITQPTEIQQVPKIKIIDATILYETFDETLNFSKLEEIENSVPAAIDEVMDSIQNEVVFEPEIVQKIKHLKNPPPVTFPAEPKETEKEQEAEALIILDDTIPEIAIKKDAEELNVSAPAVENEVEDETLNFSKLEQMTNDDTKVEIVDKTLDVSTTEEAKVKETNVEDVKIKETLNGTFEIDDSVFTNEESKGTIVIEDTPLKPKTPQITLRRPFKRQQNAEESLMSVSCMDKSILKRKKRSLSTGDIPVNMTMQERRVKFHSPANMTVQIDEIDERLLKGFTETNGRHQRVARRKRSLSDVDYTQFNKESAKKSFKSKKMPDFAAIHSKQINKMESIADSLARKQERALLLTTPDKKKHIDPSSSLKKKPLETAPVPSTSKSSVMLTHVSEEEKLPAMELTEDELIQELTASVETEKEKPIAAIKPQKSVEKVHKFKFGMQFKPASRVPKPAGQKTPVFSFAAKSAFAAMKNGNPVLVKPVNLADKMQNTTVHAGPSSSRAELPQTSRTAMKGKPGSREEMHKSLYKAKKVCNGERSKSILQGVRLNKRFKLQMQFRDTQKE